MKTIRIKDLEGKIRRIKRPVKKKKRSLRSSILKMDRERLIHSFETIHNRSIWIVKRELVEITTSSSSLESLKRDNTRDICLGKGNFRTR